MNTEPKREWAYDGTREEFWGVLLVLIVFLAGGISLPVSYLEGHVPDAQVDWKTWFSLVVAFCFIFYFAFLGDRLEKWVSVAFGVSFAAKGVHILIGYGKLTGPNSVRVLILLQCGMAVLFLTAIAIHLGTHLRREIRADSSN